MAPSKLVPIRPEVPTPPLIGTIVAATTIDI